MEHLKLPNQLTNEELEELLNNPTESSTLVSESSEIIRFLSIFKIVPGKSKVLPNLLYSIYKKWSPRAVSARIFANEMNKFIPRTKNANFYLISKSSLAISKETEDLFKPILTSQYKSKYWHHHFKLFLRHYDIKHGSYWIEEYILYHFYDLWCYSLKRSNQLSPITFRMFCKGTFKHTYNVSLDLQKFQLDPTLLTNLTSEQIGQLHSGFKRKHAKKESKSKKRSKISSTGT